MKNAPADVGGAGSVPGPGRPHLAQDSGVRERQALQPARLQSAVASLATAGRGPPSTGTKTQRGQK